MPSLLKFVVQLIEQDIGQERTERTTLRHSLVRVLEASVSQDYSRFEILEDEFQDSWIGDAFAELPHEFLMIDSVKERLQIAINDVTLFAFEEGFFELRCQAKYCCGGPQPPLL